MRILVTLENMEEVIGFLCSIHEATLALDTETYGLKWDDKLFALQIAVRKGGSYYFNFHEYNDGTPVLPRSVFAELRQLWSNRKITWVMANAKFDLRKIDIEGVTLQGDVYDVQLMERIRYNRHFSYSLDACLKRMGMAKDDRVMEWIKENKAHTIKHVEGKATKEKDLHFERVPFPIMFEYGLSDVELTLSLYDNQLAYFSTPENMEQIHLVGSNVRLTKTVFDMEKVGIQLDISYCKERAAEEQAKVDEIATKIEELTAMKFETGPKWLTEVLRLQGINLEISAKGNPVLDKHALKAIPNAIAHLVLEMREHEKRAISYQNLLRFADKDGVLHTNYKLNGTDTFRFSSENPNLQNIEACEKGDMKTPRTAFIPRPGYLFASIDYKAMEYRLAADIAGETEWIDAINKGADPHQFVADLMGVERKYAKTLNFMNLYGGGVAKLAMAVGKPKSDEATLKALCKRHVYKSRLKPAEVHLCSLVDEITLQHDVVELEKANALQKKYFDAVPRVKAMMYQVQQIGKQRGFVRNQYGMRYFLGDDHRFAYKLPNHLIQGTGGCIIRDAMPKIAELLAPHKSRILLQIHDELLLEIHETEKHLINEVKKIMESVYKPINGMKMECDAEISSTSWNANTFTKWEQK